MVVSCFFYASGISGERGRRGENYTKRLRSAIWGRIHNNKQLILLQIMKKVHFLFFAALLWVSVGCHAHENLHTMLKIGRVWNTEVEYVNCDTPLDTIIIKNKYIVSGNSEKDGRQCLLIVKHAYRCSNNRMLHEYIDSLYMFEDNGRIYKYDDRSGYKCTWNLEFDFTLSTGGMFQNAVQVSDIQTVEVKGKNYHYFFFGCAGWKA